MTIKTVKDIDLKEKRVLVRVDFNVTLRPGARIVDDFRLEQSLSTLSYLLEQRCLVLLLSHLGRPEGRRVQVYSLRPLAKRLEQMIRRKVNFFDQDYTQESARIELAKYGPGEIVLLENVRFYPGEEDNDQQLAKKLSLLADVFINDAFGVSHRKHASIVGIPQFLPSVAGLLLAKEVDFIGRVISEPEKPMLAIIGGAKLEDKLPIIGKLIDRVDYCLVGGKIAMAFLKVKGEKVGRVFVDEETEKLIKELFFQAAVSNTALMLPVDVVRGDGQGLDIGPKTRKMFSGIIKKAKTIIWVGPMGFYEQKRFAKGTEAIYRVICQNRGSLSIIGGGDTIAALKNKKYLQTIDHISTGGGAMLQFIETGTLPGIEALKGK
ncbi:MAG TPA: phosphoglycerate kinase [Candidatus Bathyarchaeia archaeon]|nr:phosphoglycerate kinase [Candidatus Bathyarchaeia archaeon]